MKTKKALSSIVSMSLLLLIVVISSISLSNWYESYSDEMLIKYTLKTTSSDLKIKNLEYYDSTYTKLYLRNLNQNTYYVIDKITVNGYMCHFLTENVIISLNTIYLDCSLTTNGVYEIAVYTDKGIFEKTIYFYK